MAESQNDSITASAGITIKPYRVHYLPEDELDRLWEDYVVNLYPNIEKVILRDNRSYPGNFKNLHREQYDRSCKIPPPLKPNCLYIPSGLLHPSIGVFVASKEEKQTTSEDQSQGESGTDDNSQGGDGEQADETDDDEEKDTITISIGESITIPNQFVAATIPIGNSGLCFLFTSDCRWKLMTTRMLVRNGEITFPDEGDEFQLSDHIVIDEQCDTVVNIGTKPILDRLNEDGSAYAMDYVAMLCQTLALIPCYCPHDGKIHLLSPKKAYKAALASFAYLAYDLTHDESMSVNEKDLFEKPKRQGTCLYFNNFDFHKSAGLDFITINSPADVGQFYDSIIISHSTNDLYPKFEVHKWYDENEVPEIQRKSRYGSHIHIVDSRMSAPAWYSLPAFYAIGRQAAEYFWYNQSFTFKYAIEATYPYILPISRHKLVCHDIIYSFDYSFDDSRHGMPITTVTTKHTWLRLYLPPIKQGGDFGEPVEYQLPSKSETDFLGHYLYEDKCMITYYHEGVPYYHKQHGPYIDEITIQYNIRGHEISVSLRDLDARSGVLGSCTFEVDGDVANIGQTYAQDSKIEVYHPAYKAKIGSGFIVIKRSWDTIIARRSDTPALVDKIEYFIVKNPVDDIEVEEKRYIPSNTMAPMCFDESTPVATSLAIYPIHYLESSASHTYPVVRMLGARKELFSDDLYSVYKDEDEARRSILRLFGFEFVGMVDGSVWSSVSFTWDNDPAVNFYIDFRQSPPTIMRKNPSHRFGDAELTEDGTVVELWISEYTVIRIYLPAPFTIPEEGPLKAEIVNIRTQSKSAYHVVAIDGKIMFPVHSWMTRAKQRPVFWREASSLTLSDCYIDLTRKPPALIRNRYWNQTERCDVSFSIDGMFADVVLDNCVLRLILPEPFTMPDDGQIPMQIIQQGAYIPGADAPVLYEGFASVSDNKITFPGSVPLNAALRILPRPAETMYDWIGLISSNSIDALIKMRYLGKAAISSTGPPTIFHGMPHFRGWLIKDVIHSSEMLPNRINIMAEQWDHELDGYILSPRIARLRHVEKVTIKSAPHTTVCNCSDPVNKKYCRAKGQIDIYFNLLKETDHLYTISAISTSMSGCGYNDTYSIYFLNGLIQFDIDLEQPVTPTLPPSSYEVEYSEGKLRKYLNGVVVYESDRHSGIADANKACVTNGSDEVIYVYRPAFWEQTEQGRLRPIVTSLPPEATFRYIPDSPMPPGLYMPPCNKRVPIVSRVYVDGEFDGYHPIDTLMAGPISSNGGWEIDNTYTNFDGIIDLSPGRPGPYLEVCRSDAITPTEIRCNPFSITWTIDTTTGQFPEQIEVKHKGIKYLLSNSLLVAFENQNTTAPESHFKDNVGDKSRVVIITIETDQKLPARFEPLGSIPEFNTLMGNYKSHVIKAAVRIPPLSLNDSEYRADKISLPYQNVRFRGNTPWGGVNYIHLCGVVITKWSKSLSVSISQIQLGGGTPFGYIDDIYFSGNQPNVAEIDLWQAGYRIDVVPFGFFWPAKIKLRFELP